MIQWSLDAFVACEAVGAIVVAAPPQRTEELAARLAADYAGQGTEPSVVAGGASRAQSVANALATVETELVAIHDAARPLVTEALLEALLADLEASPDAAGVISAAPVADTLKRASETTSDAFPSPGDRNASLAIEATVDRGGLWAAQTPQLFRTEALRSALAVSAEARDAATDEAMLLERAGATVLLHHCETPNLKVTTPADLRLAELLLADRISAD